VFDVCSCSVIAVTVLYSTVQLCGMLEAIQKPFDVYFNDLVNQKKHYGDKIPL